MQTLKPIISAMIITILLAACSSKANDEGTQLGNEIVDVHKEFANKRIEAYQTMIAELSQKVYTSREFAYYRLDSLNSELDHQQEEKLEKLNKNLNEARKKYADSRSDIKEFNTGYNTATADLDNDSISGKIEELTKQINQLILQITPKSPSTEQIKINLHGCRVIGADGDYLNLSDSRTIDAATVSDIKITSAENDGPNYTIEAQVTFDGEAGGKFIATVRLEYLLADNVRWELKMIESRKLEPVKTGRFDTCVTSKIEDLYGTGYLTLVNHTDQSMLVGGRYCDSNGEWHKFCKRVAPADQTTVYSWYYGHTPEYHIDFVELP